MTSKKLTYAQRSLLECYHDGALDSAGVQEVRELIRQMPAAQDVLDALLELSVAARVATAEAWEHADAPAAADVALASVGAKALMERDLVDLVGLLDRVHDQEADVDEIAEVERLIQGRGDVADYVAGLDELSHGAKISYEELGHDVDFGCLWSNIEARLDVKEGVQDASQGELVAFPGTKKPSTTERPVFDLDNHRVMLYRHYDGEATEKEQAQVTAWAEIDSTVAVTLAALGELKLAANAAIEFAQERQDLSSIWAHVHGELGEELAHQASPVISFQDEKKKRKGVLRHWRRELFAAVAAAVFTIVGISFLQGPQKVVVEKTVVIVDSVETLSSNTSVMVTGPTQRVSKTFDKNQAESEPSNKAAQDEVPTVIWLIDSDDQTQGEEGEESESKGSPKKSGTKYANPKGQPI